MNALRQGAGLVLLTIAGGCSGGGSDGGLTPPSDAVASVTVSPTPIALAEADSLRLTATAKTASGSVVTGKAVTWSTSAGTIATVSALGTVSAVSAGTAIISATVDGKTGTATVSVQPAARMEIDAGSVASKSIGAGGGTLTTTSAGLSYSLIVPKGAIADTKQFVISPLKVLRQLPAGGEFVAAVKLEPSGTTFFKPLTLRIVAHVTPASGKKLLGYLANDTGAVVTFAPGVQHGDTLSLTLSHFSVGGFGQFVQAQVPAAPLIGTPGSQGYINQIDAARAAGAPIATFVPIFQSWYFQIVEPELLGAGLPDEYVNAAGDTDLWWSNVSTRDWTAQEFFGLEQGVHNEVIDLLQQLPGVLLHGVQALNSRCGNSPVFGYDATRVFLLQSIAAEFHFDTPAFGLDLPSVTSGLCLQVMNTIANFPANPVPGTPENLELRYGVKVGTNTQLQDQLFKVTMDLVGTTTDGTQQLQTDTQGRMSGSLTLTGNTSFLAQMHACIHPDVGAFLDNVCMTHSVTRSFVPVSVFTSSLPNASLGTPYSTTLTAIGGAGGYQWTSAPLPAGLSLSSAGVLSGTPTQAGVFTFTVQVTSNGRSATASLTLTVGSGTWELAINWESQSGPTGGQFRGSINIGVLGSLSTLHIAFGPIDASQNVCCNTTLSGIFNANVSRDASGEFFVLSGVTIAGPRIEFTHNDAREHCDDNDIVLPEPLHTVFGGFSGAFQIVGKCNIKWTGLQLMKSGP